MSRNQAAKRLFSSLARQAEAGASGVKSSGQGMLATRSTIVNLTGGAGASTVNRCTRCHCGRAICLGHHNYSTSTRVAQQAAQPAYADADCVSSDLAARHQTVLSHFPTSLSADDYMSRVEVALAGYGFTGDNTIAMSNLCRDESCMILEDKIESVFGSCFSTHGLGGVLTCGVIGISAGLSHSPVQGGKERYVFFSFPHIAIDSDGNVGGIARPNRAAASSACGALIACTSHLKAEGLDANLKVPGVHDPMEPEYSILKQRLARRLKYEGADHTKLDLVSVTKAAERTITSDLEYLIEKAVDTNKADYAVFTGVQIHNWATDLMDESVPSIEFVSVGKSYVVVNGEKTFLDVHQVPALSPRQLKMLGSASIGGQETLATAATAGGMIQEIPREYLLKRLGGVVGKNMVSGEAGSWKKYVKTTWAEAHPNAPKLDDKLFASEAPVQDTFSTTFGKKL
uniref:LCI420 protein n=1 Tax=Chlorella sp. ArM0029B TaxID=1415603 RepID=A0A345AXC4_9CHLO|nr:LCI420 protein [Chlorella sp. ArM0029B]